MHSLIFISQVYTKSKASNILRTNWAYLTIPFVLYLFHNKNGPLSMQHIREHPNIPTYGVYISAIFLLYNFVVSGFSKKSSDAHAIRF